MRFKRGTKVEILCKKGIPSGFWRCGEIVCGNARSYTVRYDDFNGINSDELYERVPRESIRPSPPRISENWIPGDVVEAFHGYSWKMATVLEVLGENFFAVRLLGSYIELELSKYRIRSRQSWDGKKWVLIGKMAGKYAGRKKQRNMERKPTLHDTQSITCSVGSCSISSSPMGFPAKPQNGSIDDGFCSDAESFCEKKMKEDNGSAFLSNRKMASELHSLELHAYRCTMEALHASGPMTWDQEAMMTNLRLCLNISNDEHLTEIKHLVTFGSCIRFR